MKINLTVYVLSKVILTFQLLAHISPTVKKEITDDLHHCKSWVGIIFQYIFGFDFFGFQNVGRYHSGPFGDELIAGGYLQKFSLIYKVFMLFYRFCKSCKL